MKTAAPRGGFCAVNEGRAAPWSEQSPARLPGGRAAGEPGGQTPENGNRLNGPGRAAALAAAVPPDPTLLQTSRRTARDSGPRLDPLDGGRSDPSHIFTALRLKRGRAPSNAMPADSFRLRARGANATRAAGKHQIA